GSTSITGTNFSGALTVSGQITGANGSLLINRPTTNFAGITSLTSAAANTFGGGVTIQSGLFSVPTGGNVGTGPITITSTGVGFNAAGELRTSATAAITLNVPVNINAGATMTTNINNANGAGGGAFTFGQSVNGAGGVSLGTIVSSGGTYTFEQA